MRRPIALALAGALALLPAQPAQANHYWGGWHWQKGGGGMAGSLTIDGIRYIGVHNAIDQGPVVQGIVNAATERWNDHNWHSAHLTPSNLPPAQFPYACDWTPPPDGWGVSVCTGTPDDPAAGADAQILRVANGHIAWVRIRVRPGYSGEQLTSVIAHELGHALGLYHRVPAVGSVMDPDGGFGWPDYHDKDVLAALYGHGH